MKEVGVTASVLIIKTGMVGRVDAINPGDGKPLRNAFAR